MFARNSTLGVDMGDDAVRIVEVRSDGAVTLAAYLPLDGAPAGEVLTGFFRETKMSVGRIAVGLPASECAVKTASLPPAAPAELAQVVRFEAETQFPLPLPEMAWHYTLAPGPEGRPHAVIAGARREAVEERLALLRAVGRATAVLLPAPLAAAGALTHPSGPHLLVVAGARWSDLCLYDGDRLLNCRSVLAGPPTSEGWAARIAREARPWLAGPESPAQVLLTGIDADGESLMEALGIPVRQANPWQDVRDPHGFQQELREGQGAFAAAIGLALAARGKAGLNMLPAQVSRARTERMRLGWTLAALLLIAAALEKERLEALLSLTYSLGMEAIVEVHTEEELLSVLETDAPILGVNNRNLNDFTVDLRTTARLMDALRSAEGEGSRIVVAESGVRSEEDAGYLAETGVDAILVGEALMRASNPEETLRSFKRKGRRAA